MPKRLNNKKFKELGNALADKNAPSVAKAKGSDFVDGRDVYSNEP
jgi:hypothetical protein